MDIWDWTDGGSGFQRKVSKGSEFQVRCKLEDFYDLWDVKFGLYEEREIMIDKNVAAK